MPVTARIDQFWSWLNFGFWAISLNSKTDVLLTGQVGSFANGEHVMGQARESKQWVADDDWRQIVTKCLQDLTANMKASLAVPER